MLSKPEAPLCMVNCAIDVEVYAYAPLPFKVKTRLHSVNVSLPNHKLSEVASASN